MDPSQIFEALTKEWDVISAVPWSFTIAIVFVATVEFLAVRSLFRREINTLNATIRIQEDRIVFAREGANAVAAARHKLEFRLRGLWPSLKRSPIEDAQAREIMVASTAAATTALDDLTRIQKEFFNQLWGDFERSQGDDGTE